MFQTISIIFIQIYQLLYVTGFCKTDRIVTLGLLHFNGPANGYTCTLHIHSAITGLGWLVCFCRASFSDPVNSWLRQWDQCRCYMEGMGLTFTPVMGGVSCTIWACLGLCWCFWGPWLARAVPAAIWPASGIPPTPYNAPSVILQWFWKMLLKIQQSKLASRISYKTTAKRLFQLYSISGMATI